MVLDTIRVTDALPVVSSIAWEEVSYASELLLNACFDASIMDHGDFRPACQCGFEGYFGCLYQDDESGNEVFVHRLYTWHEVQSEIVAIVARCYDAWELAIEQLHGVLSLARRAGYTLGWLSALALVDPALAVQGVDLLVLLVSACQLEESQYAARRSVGRVTGANAFPLDMEKGSCYVSSL